MSRYLRVKAVSLPCYSWWIVNSSSVQSVAMSSPTLVFYHAPSTRSVPPASRHTRHSSPAEGQCRVPYVGRPSPCHRAASTTSRSTPSSPACWIYATSSLLHHHMVKVKLKVKVNRSLRLPPVLTNSTNCNCIYACVYC